MNKKKWLNFIGIMVLASVVGCNKEAVTETPTSSIQSTADLFEKEENSTTSVIDISEKGELRGKQVEFEKVDAAELAKYNSSNRFRSRIPDENQQSLFCIDPDTGVVYFINQNKDWYIYQLHNGKAELAVELPARELYMWEGTLYFIIEDYDKYKLLGINENDIYAYTPADGTVRFIYTIKEFENAVESHLGVDEKGLYLYCGKEGKETTYNGNKGYMMESFYYVLPFGTLEVEEDPCRKAVSGWGDYYFHPASSSLKSRVKEDEESLRLDVPASKSCIIGDKFYSVSSGNIVLYITDIVSQEVMSYECKAVLKELIGDDIEKEQVSWIQSFTVTKDCVWMIVRGSYLLKIDPESGEIQCYVINELNYYIEKLYTDGVGVYALYKSGSFSNPAYLVQINTEEIVGVSRIYGIPELAIEYLTQ